MEQQADFFEQCDFVWLDANGEKFFVSDGISGGEKWGAFKRSKSGGLRRVRSSALPMVNSKGEAQKNLHRWAMRRGLKLLCVYGKQLETVARLMHETYEAAAKENGWKTQASCHVSFDELPEANRKTMLAVAEAVVRYFLENFEGVTGCSCTGKL